MIEAAYYDGRTARRRAVRLMVDAAQVVVHGEDFERRAPLSQVLISEKLGRAPRKLTFDDGAFCEVRDLGAFERQLGQAGVRDSHVERLQDSWTVAVIALLTTIGIGVAGYLWGLPWAASATARMMPPEVTQFLSRETLELLDRIWLEPSELAPARRLELAAGFAHLQQPQGAAHRYHLEFRSSPAIGPNAFALPDGTIVLLDELVALGEDDEQILAVLGHELGHVHHRHGLRILIQGTIAGALAAWWLGDTSTLLAAVPAALAQARYSRAFETEADAYGAAMLRANGLQPARLAEMLEKLMQAHHIKTEGKEGEADWSDYLASHPAPAQRIRSLRGERDAAPAGEPDG